MASGEQIDSEESRGNSPSDRPPHSSSKPTLAGIKNSKSDPPKMITKHGLAPPPATDSDPPPPILDSTPPPAADEHLSSFERPGELRQHPSHSRELVSAGDRGSTPSRPPPFAVTSQKNAASGNSRGDDSGERAVGDQETMPAIPRPPALALDHQAMIAASEEVTPSDDVGLSRAQERALAKKSRKEARANFKTVPGGGRNRLSGGREVASAYVRPDTLQPSRGRVGTHAGIKLDDEVVREARSYVTEPSLLVRRASSLPPPLADGYGSRPGTKQLIVIVLGAALFGIGSVWGALSLLGSKEEVKEPEAATKEEQPSAPAAKKAEKERNEASPGPKPDTRPIVAPKPTLAPRARVTKKAKPAAPTRRPAAPQNNSKKESASEAPSQPSATPRKVNEEPWLE